MIPIGGKLRPKIVEKRWDRSEESKIIDSWWSEGIYKFNYDVNDPRPIIVFDTPPPYASGPWNVGNLAHYMQIDMVGRYFRMRGFNVLLPFYADRNGLPVEVQVERKLGLNIHEIASTPIGREKFIELCKAELDNVEKLLIDGLIKSGCSFEYWRSGTDSPEYRRITQATFIELFKNNLIYEAERPVNWCPRCRTTLADAELEYRSSLAKLYYIKFGIHETGGEIVIATTRPELLGACAIVIYNPNDDRYKHLKGLHAIVPIYDRVVPIVERPEAKPDFGTGLAMICSYGDSVDVKIFRDMNLEPRVLIDRDGRMNDYSGFLRGLSITEARDSIVNELKSRNLIVKIENIEHEHPVCWRCKTSIEFIHSKEYFLKQVEFKEDLKKIIDLMIFYPEEHKKRLIDWITSVSTDWPISKDRYYATEVPVWKCKVCNNILLPEPGRYYRPWIDKPPFNLCPICGASIDNIYGEVKVLDTWFDSSISVLYVSMYGDKLFDKLFNNTVRPQGYDIIRTWLYYSILRVYQLLKKPAFKYVRISGMGLDEKGEAMHKSKGNVIDPKPYIDKYGVDAFRFWAAAASKLGSDYRFSEQLIKTGALFVTKLWNLARFISSFPFPEISDVEFRPLDLAMISALNKLIEKCISAYDSMDVYTPANEIYNFAWNVFASHYLEAVKSRVYNEHGKYRESQQKASWYTLHTVFSNILKLLAPIMPIITDSIWRMLYSNRSIHLERIMDPDPRWNYPTKSLELLISANSKIWSYKRSMGLRLNDPLKVEVKFAIEYSDIIDELVDLHLLMNYKIIESTGERIEFQS
ncbi:MAG: valine--tRNA ligase [Candidatus Methanomethylicia archaeon]